MSFLNIAALWHLAWIAPLFFLLYFGAKAKRQKTLCALLGSRAADESFSTLSRRARFIRFIVMGLATALLVVAIARPCWGTSIVPFTSKGRDILFAIDVSKSMLAKDVQPSRIDHAKWLARQIVKASPGDRFGLIAFAGTASLDCPLTTDMASFNQVLDEIEPGSAALGGTNIQAALETALKAFNAAESGHRAVVLITDGDELTGNSASVISLLKAKKIPLFIAGVGDPSQPGLIPVKGEDGKTTFLRDSSGELVKSALNEKQLSELALGSGGIYVRSTVTTPGIEILENRIKALVPKDLDNGIHSKPIERFQIPLTAALILLFIWFMIPEKKKSPKITKAAVAALLLIPFIIPFSSNAAESPVPLKQPGLLPAPPATVQPVDAGKNGEAALKDMAFKNIDELFNKARELHEKSPQDAVKLYQKAINDAAARPDIRAKACQNLGVLQHYKSRNVLTQSLGMVKQQNLDGALQNIDSAMKEFDKAEEFYRQAMTSEKMAMKNNEPDKKAAPAQNSDILLNQQKLLNDKKAAEDLKKKIEELKKQQQEAQKKTQQAKDEQQKANQDKQQNKDQKDQKDQKQDKKDQQNKQDKKDQQNKQDKKDQQNKQDKQQQNKDQKQQQNKDQKDKQDQKQEKSQEKQTSNQDKQQKQAEQDQKDQQSQQDKADQARSEAQKSVDDLKKKADELQQKNISDSANAAKEELKKAEQAAEQNKGKEAEKHIQKALEKLVPQDKNNQDNKDQKQDKNNQDKQDQKNQNKDQNKQDKKDQKQDQKDQQDQKEQDKQGQQDQKNQQDRKLPENKGEQQPAAAAKAQKQEKEIDEKQAEALLELMAGQEKNLRDAIKEYQKKHYQQEGPEKDW